MRKLSLKRQIWLDHYSRSVVPSKRRRRASRRLRSSSAGVEGAHLHVPAVVDIVDATHRAATLAFLGALRREFAASSEVPVVLDFANTTKLWAPGMLLVYAELSRLRALWPLRKVRITRVRNRKVGQVLDQLKLLEACGYSRKFPSYADDVIHWNVAAGSQVDNELCNEGLRAFEGRLAASLYDGVLRGLGEAQTNTVHHAYIVLPRKDGLDVTNEVHRWWMFSQEKRGVLFVAFCDLGAGIPATLPLTWSEKFTSFVSRFAGSKEAEIIKWAVEESRTRTSLQGRGKGLGQIVSVLDQQPESQVMIMSNRGLYAYQRAGSGIYLKDFKDSILGTIIQWSTPVPHKEASHG